MSKVDVATPKDKKDKKKKKRKVKLVKKQRPVPLGSTPSKVAYAENMSKLLALRDTFKPTGSIMARVNAYGRDAIRTIAPIHDTYNFPHFRQVAYGKLDEVSKWQADSEQVREAKEQQFLLKHAMAQAHADAEVRKTKEKMQMEMIEREKRFKIEKAERKLQDSRLSERERKEKQREKKRFKMMYEAYTNDNSDDVYQDVQNIMHGFAINSYVKSHPHTNELLESWAKEYAPVIDQYNGLYPNAPIKPNAEGMERLLGWMTNTSGYAFSSTQRPEELSRDLIHAQRKLNDIKHGKLVFQIHPDVMR
jgi:hypothetical protein